MTLVATFTESTSLLAILLSGGLLTAGAALFKVKPERDSTIVKYQGEILEDLYDENKRLKEELADVRIENKRLSLGQEELRARIIELEKSR